MGHQCKSFALMGSIANKVCNVNKYYAFSQSIVSIHDAVFVM